MLKRIYAALMIVLTMFGGTNTPQQSAPAPSDTNSDTVKQTATQGFDTHSTMLSQSDAEKIALKSLGINRSDVHMERTELDREKGQPVWEVEFYYQTTEYDIEIDAHTGEIIKTNYEQKERPVTDQPIIPEITPATPPTADVTELTEDQALVIALDDAGLTLDKISKLRTEKDRDDGVTVFEIEFYWDNTEYDYTVHAITGKILEKDVDVKKTNVIPTPDPIPAPTPIPVTPSEPEVREITKDDAIAIALEHAGLKTDEVKRLKVEKDYEKGVLVYEIEFEKGIVEYEYEIRVSDGKILKWDKEIDD